MWSVQRLGRLTGYLDARCYMTAYKDLRYTRQLVVGRRRGRRCCGRRSDDDPDLEVHSPQIVYEVSPKIVGLVNFCTIAADDPDCVSDDTLCETFTETFTSTEIFDGKTELFEETKTYLTAIPTFPPAVFQTKTLTKIFTSTEIFDGKTELIEETTTYLTTFITFPPAVIQTDTLSASRSLNTVGSAVTAPASSSATQPPSSSASVGTSTAPVTASASSTAKSDTNTHIGAPVANSHPVSPAVIGAVVVLVLLAILAAVILWLRRRRSQRHRHNSRFTLDPESRPVSERTPVSTVNLRYAVLDSPERRDTVALPSYSASISSVQPAPNPHQDARLAQLENQARAVQQEIEALRGSNLNNAESGPSTVSASQVEKFDSLAARGGKLTTSREPEPSEDVPPEYELSSTSTT
ncbi:hypothetical protein K438DRAFT_1929091 [Mycena galopus ATCC 62051]|nr:hypothetical protein K438DRAFT_1929091 [Mycena galopus ATCC 62051]